MNENVKPAALLSNLHRIFSLTSIERIILNKSINDKNTNV